MKTYSFAFIVHSRNYRDIYRKYPALKVLPKFFLLFILKHLRPITVSKVTGLRGSDGAEVPGWVIGIPMTAEQMMHNRPLALKRIRQALYLARDKGAKIAGLGGLTSSLSGGGKELLDIPIILTTGHAYTAYNVTQNLFTLAEMFEIPKEKVKVAVVGAAGSIGSMSALLIARERFPYIKIIDVERKKENLITLKKEIAELDTHAQVVISPHVSDISDCDFVITATNTPEALVTPDIVRDGMVIIDDAQPSDIHPDVLKMGNVLVIEAGVVHTPGIHSNFNYGLKNRTDNFCCMAELLILAANKRQEHYVIHRATLAQVDEIAEMGQKLQFTVASFQNFLESVSPDKISTVKSFAQKKSLEKHLEYHGL